MAEDTTVLFEDDFSNDSAAVSGDPPAFSGPYKVRLNGPTVAPNSSGNPRVSYTLDVLEDPSGRDQEGTIIFDGNNVPQGEKAHVGRRYWLATLESLGHNMAALKKKFKLTIGMLDQKVGYVKFVTKEESDSGYAKVVWLTKERYEAAAKRIAALAAAGKLAKAVSIEDDEVEATPVKEAVSVNTAYNEQDLLNLT